MSAANSNLVTSATPATPATTSRPATTASKNSPARPHQHPHTTDPDPTPTCTCNHKNTRLTTSSSAHTNPAAMSSKKGKQNKLDSRETSKLVAARISQLELDAAEGKDQEAEIEREVKKATRELHNQTSKLEPLQRIDMLTKRCSELLADMKRHERESQKNKKRADQVQKEKDASRTELSKTVGLKEKLEKLCRELQKENNKLKNENKTLSDNLAHNQKSCDETYSLLLQKLESYVEEKENPRKQIIDMDLDKLFQTRFKSFIEQYELRELHFHSVMRTKELEVQYNLARYERERKNAEAEVARSRQLNAQVQNFSRTESELRQQLNVYVDKFKQVEDTLNNSNDLFMTFRKEMEDMSKKTKRLEKDNESLKRKHEKTNQNIVTMAEERSTMLDTIKRLERKECKLNGIIRHMQKQGRGMVAGMTVKKNGYGEENGVDDEDESEYEYEDDVDDEAHDDADCDDYIEETEDEAPSAIPVKTFGPERPPPAAAAGNNNGTATAAMTNGHH